MLRWTFRRLAATSRGTPTVPRVVKSEAAEVEKREAVAWGIHPASLVTKLDVTPLKPPHTGIPSDDRQYTAELSGQVDLDWLANAPALRRRLSKLREVPPKAELFALPTDMALDAIADASSYYEVLTLISTHSWPHLIPTALTAVDAPLPHVVYEDVMRALVFSSHQQNPMQQFALDPTVLRSLLCRAAEHCLTDPAYFVKVESWFRLLDQQQALSAEGYSAFVMCCVCAGRLEMAMTFAKQMDVLRYAFDPVVFSLLMHPSESVVDVMRGEAQHRAKGMLLQQRLAAGLRTHGAGATAIHAAFVLLSLSHQHTKKWELIRIARTLQMELSPRTLRLVTDTFNEEQGRYCGPRTTKALCLFFAEEGRVDRVAAVLMAVRASERRRAVPALACTAFSKEEAEELYQVCRRTSPQETQQHAAMLRHLVLDVEPTHTVNNTVEDGRRAGERTAPHRDGSWQGFVFPVRATPDVAMKEGGGGGGAVAPPQPPLRTDPGTIQTEASRRQPWATSIPNPVPSAATPLTEVALRRSSKPPVKRRGKGKRGSKRSSKLPSTSSADEKHSFAEDRAPLASAIGSSCQGSSSPKLNRVALLRGRRHEEMRAVAEREELTAQSHMDDDLHNQEAFQQALYERAQQRQDAQQMLQQLGTAWMNPEAHYRTPSSHK